MQIRIPCLVEVSKNDEFSIKTEKLCVKNEEFCIENGEFEYRAATENVRHGVALGARLDVFYI